MLLTGFTLAVMSGIGFYLIYRKLPNRIKRTIKKHGLLTDITVCILTYLLFGKTLTALFAAAILGIFISILLVIISNEETNEILELIIKQTKIYFNKIVNYLIDALSMK